MQLWQQIIWYFFIYAFLGWSVEVIYAALLEKRFVNRGFLNGPLCPIYGFGVLLVLNLLRPFQDNVFLLFGGSVLITSAIEFLAGFLLEKIFHQRWWDYRDKPFHLGGYICLSFSILWGLACLIVVDRVNPMVVRLVERVPALTGTVILILMSFLFAVDLIATVMIILKLNAKLKAITEITEKLREASEDIGERLADGTISLAEKSEGLREKMENRREEWKQEMSALLEKPYPGHRRLLKAFPRMKSTRHKESLEKIRSYVEQKKQKKL